MQTSPGKNDNLRSIAVAFTVWDSGSIGLSLVLESRPSQVSLICDFCSSAQNFAHWELFIPQSSFLQIPPRDRHPCLRLMLPTTKRIVDFHHQVIAHAGRTSKAEEQAFAVSSALFFVFSKCTVIVFSECAVTTTLGKLR